MAQSPGDEFATRDVRSRNFVRGMQDAKEQGQVSVKEAAERIGLIYGGLAVWKGYRKFKKASKKGGR